MQYVSLPSILLRAEILNFLSRLLRCHDFTRSHRQDKIRYSYHLVRDQPPLYPCDLFLEQIPSNSPLFEPNLTARRFAETANAASKDIDVLFQMSKTWIIGPESRLKPANIVAGREEAENSHIKGKHIASHKSQVEIIEDNKL